MAAEEKVFRALVTHLVKENYHFICPSPSSQARIIQRRNANRATRYATNLTDLFGWSLPAEEETLVRLLPLPLLGHLRDNKIIRSTDSGYRSAVRISNLRLPHITDTNSSGHQARLYLIHPAFPPTPKDDISFGPETYLYLDFLTAATHHISRDPCIVVEVCCGSGAGAMHIARRYSGAQVFGLDDDPKHLELARLNASLDEANVDFVQSDLYAGLPRVLQEGDVDLIVGSPVYLSAATNGLQQDGLASTERRAYEGLPGLESPIRIVEQGMRILALGGLLVIFTCVPISVEKPGCDPFLHRLQHLEGAEVVEYRVVHPDARAEEGGKGILETVGRVQLVGVVVRKFT